MTRDKLRTASVWGLRLLVLGAFFVAAENYTAPKFSECTSKIGAYQAAKNAHQYGLVFSDFIRGQGVCTLSLIDRHNGFFSFLGTIAIATFTLSLWRSTDRLWKSAENTSRWQLRAYVHVTLTGNTRITANAGEVARSVPGLINSGQTPAMDVLVYSNICVADFPLTASLPPILISSGGSKATIYPGQTGLNLFIESEAPITEEDMQLATPTSNNPSEAKSHRFYLYGFVSYKDVFGESHTTNFRVVTSGVGGGSPILWCADGNEMT